MNQFFLSINHIILTLQNLLFPNTNITLPNIHPTENLQPIVPIELPAENKIELSANKKFIQKIKESEQNNLAYLYEQYKQQERIKQHQDKHLPMPKMVKGIYMTSDSFVKKSSREALVKLIEETELNAVVIDIRDRYGKMIFAPNHKKIADTPLSSLAKERTEIQKILADLQAKNIYTIVRIVTLQDTYSAQKFPELALKKNNGNIWYNHLGLAWLDMTNPDAWEIPLAYAIEATDLGFDEIQFDYIRFPTDGYLKNIVYKNPPLPGQKWKTMTKVFEFLSQNMSEKNIPISADIFGFAYHKTYKDHDLNIGQRVIDATKYFDALSGMVYASHYSDGYMGFENPAEFPGPIVAQAMESGNWLRDQVENSKSTDRPWLQDFSLGAKYGPTRVRAQIDAVENNGGSGWLLWNARNVYTRGALKNAPKPVITSTEK